MPRWTTANPLTPVSGTSSQPGAQWTWPAIGVRTSFSAALRSPVYGPQPLGINHVDEHSHGALPLLDSSAYGEGKGASGLLVQLRSEGHGYDFHIARGSEFPVPGVLQFRGELPWGALVGRLGHTKGDGRLPLLSTEVRIPPTGFGLPFSATSMGGPTTRILAKPIALRTLPVGSGISLLPGWKYALH